MCKQGKKFIDQSDQCPHCEISLDDKPRRANHIRWCQKNPKRLEYVNGLSLARDCITDESLTKVSNAQKANHKNGRYKNVNRDYMKGRKLSEETKAKISASSRASNHQRVCKSSHEYVDKNGRVFIFDSKWEDALADRLDELNFKWIRPNPINYIDKEGKNRKYFADFYLPDYNLYLDPKNSYAENCQRDKLEIVSKMINLIILRSLEECQLFSI